MHCQLRRSTRQMCSKVQLIPFVKTTLSPNAREEADKLVKLALDRKTRKERASTSTSADYPPTPEGLTLGTGDRPPALGTYTSPAPYRVFRVIRNPAASGLTRDRQLTPAALKLVKS